MTAMHEQAAKDVERLRRRSAKRARQQQEKQAARIALGMVCLWIAMLLAAVLYGVLT